MRGVRCGRGDGEVSGVCDVDVAVPGVVGDSRCHCRDVAAGLALIDLDGEDSSSAESTRYREGYSRGCMQHGYKHGGLSNS